MGLLICGFIEANLRALGTTYLHAAFTRKAINTPLQYEGSIESPTKQTKSTNGKCNNKMRMGLLTCFIEASLRALGTTYLHAAFTRKAINTPLQYEGSIESPPC